MSTNFNPTCFSCGNKLNLSPGNVGRGESCPECSSDIRVCLNCIHYSLDAYNECRESNAERIVEKTRANFCDYFSLSGEGKKGSSNKSKEEALAKLEDLFKKPNDKIL